MRIVLDTNVSCQVSSSPGLRPRSWAPGPNRLDLLATVDILGEYTRVATRLSKKYPSVDAESVIDLVIRVSRIVEPAPVPADACDRFPS